MPRVSLDNPKFDGRLKSHRNRHEYTKRPVQTVKPRSIEDIRVPGPIPVADIKIQLPADDLKYTKPASLDYSLPNIIPEISSIAVRYPPGVDPPKASVRRAKRSLPLPAQKSQTVFMAMAIGLFSIGIWLAYGGFKTTQQVKAGADKITANSEQGTDENPSEIKPNPKTFSSYVVPADQPKLILIPEIKVNSRVIRLGVKANSHLDTPHNVFDAGWYENSAKPGDDNGAILVDGHVSGPTKRGIFYSLNKLSEGDEIKLVRGDGRTFTYQVVAKKSYPSDKVDMSSALKSIDPDKAGLNLITCSGKLDIKTKQYEERLVVFAVAK